MRSVAAELGVSKNAAHRALHVLCASGFIVAVQRRSSDGRFEIGTYDLALPAQIIEPAMPRAPVVDLLPLAHLFASSPVPSSPAPHVVVEQLVLLPLSRRRSCSSSQVLQQLVEVRFRQVPAGGLGWWAGRCCG